MRVLVSIMLAMSSLCTTLCAQLEQAVLKVYGPSGHQMGASVAHAGDVDHDGFGDIVVGLPEAGTAGASAGAVRVISGKDGTVVWIQNGATGERLGTTVAGGMDMDGDGVPDFAAGWNLGGGTSSGGVRVWSGATGALLFQRSESGGLGLAMEGCDDLNGDGLDELIVGLPFFDAFPSLDVGRVRILRYVPLSASHAIMLTISGGTALGEFGRSVSSAGDVDGDGVEDFAAGEPGWTTVQGGFNINPGRVRIYSGAAASTGVATVLRTYRSNDSFGRIGYSLDAGKDIDGDGVPDLVAGTSVEICEVFRGAGPTIALYAYVSPTGQIDGLGLACALIGDVDGDGRSEFAIGQPLYGFTGTDDGQVSVYDSTGTLLTTLAGRFAAHHGASLAGGGDVDGDGVGDLIAGAPLEEAESALASAPDPGSATVYTFVPPRTHSMSGIFSTFGGFATALGDLDGDGRDDYAVSSPRDAPVLLTPGRVQFYKGTTGALLYTHAGAQNADRFGHCVARIGDIDGDGRDDYLVGAPDEDVAGISDAGSVYAFSGAASGLLYVASAQGATFSTGHHGQSVVGLGDLDGDGVPEFAASSPGSRLCPTCPTSGVVVIHSGVNGVALRVFMAPGAAANGDVFGHRMAAIGDIDGDGIGELAVGASGSDIGGMDSGRVVIFDGSTLLALSPTVLFDIAGSSVGERFGTSVAAAGDFDGDGVPDLIAGAPFFSSATAANRGRARIYSGSSGNLVFTISGGLAGSQMGIGVTGVGDVDDDGRSDVAVMAPGTTSGPAATHGRVVVYSGAGFEIARYEGADFHSLGRSIAGLGDVTGDCRPDILLADDAGEVWIVSPLHPTGARVFGRGTPGCAGDLCLDSNSPPRIGNQDFAITCQGAPPFGSGLLIAADYGAHLSPGLDLLGVGLILHVDVVNWPVLVLPLASDIHGTAILPAPIPDIAGLAGLHYVLQAVWFFGACQPVALGYASSNGLDLTLLPSL